jgi:hypothetical protein
MKMLKSAKIIFEKNCKRKICIAKKAIKIQKTKMERDKGGN